MWMDIPTKSRTAFQASAVLGAPSFVELDCVDQFCVLAKKLCDDLKGVGIHQMPYTEKGLERFRSMSMDRQREIVGHLKTYYLALEHAGSYGSDPRARAVGK